MQDRKFHEADSTPPTPECKPCALGRESERPSPSVLPARPSHWRRSASLPETPVHPAIELVQSQPPHFPFAAELKPTLAVSSRVPDMSSFADKAELTKPREL